MVWSIWGETSCPSSFWFVFYFSTLILWLCLFVVFSVCVCARALPPVCVFRWQGVRLCASLRTPCIFAQTEPQVTSRRKKKIAVAQLVVKLIWRPTKAGDTFLLFHALQLRQSHSRFFFFFNFTFLIPYVRGQSSFLSSKTCYCSPFLCRLNGISLPLFKKKNILQNLTSLCVCD